MGELSYTTATAASGGKISVSMPFAAYVDLTSWNDDDDVTTDEPEMYPEELKVHVRAVHDFLLKHGAIEPEKDPFQLPPLVPR